MTKPRPPVAFERRMPEGDDAHRDICTTCGFVNYINPKVVTGAIVRHEDKILICRRAIEPRVGYWTLPSGFMEVGETVEQSALRETREEANAEMEIERLFAVYSLPHIDQVQILFLGRLIGSSVSAGVESLEVRFVSQSEIPWDELAFPTTHWALEDYFSLQGQSDFVPFSNSPVR